MSCVWSTYWSEFEQSLFCVAHDVTERKRLEKLKEEFLSMVSHDLRSPLASITGSFELMSAGVLGPLSPEIDQELKKSGRNGYRLLALINDLLDLEKLSAGKLALVVEPVKTAELLAEAAADAESIIRQRELELIVDCSRAEQISGDRDRLEQCLAAIIETAAGFTVQKSKLVVSVQSKSDEVRIIISGPGEGISEPQLLQMFERYPGASKTDAASHSLRADLRQLLCKKIVELHRGTLEASCTDCGAYKFLIRLPLSAEQQITQSGSSDGLRAIGAAPGMVGIAPGIVDSASEAEPDRTVIDTVIVDVSTVDSPATVQSAYDAAAASSAVEVTDVAPGRSIDSGNSPNPDLGTAHLGTAHFGTAPISAFVSTGTTPERGWQAKIEKMQNNLGLSTKGAIMVGIPLFFELLFVLFLVTAVVQANIERDEETRQMTISRQAVKMVIKTYEAVMVMTSATPWEQYRARILEIEDLVKQLHGLTDVDSMARHSMDKIDRVAFYLLRHFHRVEEIIHKGGYSQSAKDEAFSLNEELTPVGLALKPAFDKLIEGACYTQTDSPERLQRLRERQRDVLLLGLLLNVGTSALLALFFTRTITRRLDVLTDNAHRLARDLPLQESLSGTDEIAHLDKVFHSMAAALSEAWHRERAVFDNSQDVICSWDPDWVISTINPACHRMWGYEPSALIGTSLRELVPAENVIALQQALTASRENAASVDIESLIIKADGLPLDMSWSVAWSAAEQRYFCVGSDISRVKELERLKSEFQMMVTEDLHTPLGAIAESSRRLAEQELGPLPEKALAQMQIIVRNTNRLLKLIGDLVEGQMLGSGKISVSVAPHSIGTLLEQSASSLEVFSKVRGIGLVVEPTDLRVLCEGDRIIQVLINLMSNAIKFSPEGGVVTVEAVAEDAGVRVSVHDQGRGVPETHRSSIFERFHQVEAADGKRAAGTGLGLPICKQLIEAHGGTIGCTSEPGKGSTFWFFLPSRL